MAKSKLIQANEKIAQKLTDTLGGIEKEVVGAYNKIENAFVERYLVHENETVAEAKQRLKNRQAAPKQF